MSPPPWLHDLRDGLYAIDADYLRPDLAAIHLLVDHGRAAVIDTGTTRSAPRVLRALEYLGLRADNVDWVMLTHVHLDHAGGAGALMAAFPEARLSVHPRGVRHMIDPARLWQATCDVYGEQAALNLYGELRPVPAERITETPEGAVLRLGSRELHFLDTPGHARHHVVIHDPTSARVFAGDTFGISYRALDVAGRAFIYPTSTPSQFDPSALRQSVSRILALQPETVLLTHFSAVGDVPRLGAEQLALIDEYEALALAHAEAGQARRDLIAQAMDALLMSRARAHGVTASDAALRDIINHDITLNTDGLISWLESRT